MSDLYINEKNIFIHIYHNLKLNSQLQLSVQKQKQIKEYTKLIITTEYNDKKMSNI